MGKLHHRVSVVASRGAEAAHGPSRQAVWEAFRTDAELRTANRISDAEFDALSRVAMLGDFRSKADLLFMLRMLRRSTGR
jgi:hypothetical protein